MSSLLVMELMVRANLGKLCEPESQLAEHVVAQFNALSKSSDERHKDLLEDVRDELADLGFVW